VYSCSDKKIRAGFDLSDRTIPLSVGQSVLEYSTHLGLKIRSLFLSDICRLVDMGALSDERTGLSFTRVTVSSNKSVVSMYNLHFTQCGN
jgi:hypothetical protein